MLEPAFIDSASGRILCTCFSPAEPLRDRPALLLLPPFAEELNKSRHVMARLGHVLSAQGIAVAIPDLHGTGDSAGDLADADWSAWRENARDVVGWLQDRGHARLMIGGLRTGALLALDGLGDLPLAPERLLLWSPVLHGRTFLTQFLRLRVAAAMSGSDREGTGDLRQRLEAGETLRVAGYDLPGPLAMTLDRLEAGELCPPPGTRVAWYELSRAEEPRVPPAAARVAEEWRNRGCDVTPQALAGDSFWATQELADAPELVRRSAVDMLVGMK